MSYTELFLGHIQTMDHSLIYLLLGVSAYVENIFPPIPGDTITAFGAFMVGIGELGFWGVYLSTTLGSLLGFISLYWVGRWLGRRFFIKRNYRFLKGEHILRAEEWFQKYGYFLIAINRFLPGIRSAIAVVGGISRLNIISVASLSLISAALWNFIWIFLGYMVGSNWENVETLLSSIMVKYNFSVLILFGLIILFFVLRRRFRKRD